MSLEVTHYKRIGQIFEGGAERNTIKYKEVIEDDPNGRQAVCKTCGNFGYPECADYCPFEEYLDRSKL